MSQRQLQRWHVMGLVEGGKITLGEAAKKIGVSYRQAKRIRRAIKEKGMRGLIHGNTGRPSLRRLSEMLRQKVLQLSREIRMNGGQATEIRYFLSSSSPVFSP